MTAGLGASKNIFFSKHRYSVVAQLYAVAAGLWNVTVVNFVTYQIVCSCIRLGKVLERLRAPCRVD